MSSLPNQAPIQSPYPHYSYPADDEIDLKELFLALWQGKWTIIITTLCFTVAAIVYALTAQQWWSAKAIVGQPQLQDIASYQQVVKGYQSLFDVYQEDGTIIVSDVLDKLVDPELIFKRFIQEFNANGNKRRFMQTDPAFLALQQQMQVNDEPENLQAFYQNWFGRIQASATDKKVNDTFTLSFQSIDKNSSLILLNQYVQFINQIMNQQLNNTLHNTLAGKYRELKLQEKNLLQQAKLRLRVELDRTQYALNIAQAAGIQQPVQNLGEQEIFAINIGSRALAAKIDALKSIKDLSIFEPRISILQTKISQFNLDALSATPKWSANAFYYLDQPEQPLNRDKPKRALICVLGTLLGGMLGVAIVLVRFAFRREDPIGKR